MHAVNMTRHMIVEWRQQLGFGSRTRRRTLTVPDSSGSVVTWYFFACHRSVPDSFKHRRLTARETRSQSQTTSFIATVLTFSVTHSAKCFAAHQAPAVSGRNVYRYRPLLNTSSRNCHPPSPLVSIASHPPASVLAMIMNRSQSMSSYSLLPVIRKPIPDAYKSRAKSAVSTERKGWKQSV